MEVIIGIAVEVIWVDLELVLREVMVPFNVIVSVIEMVVGGGSV